MSHDPKPAMMPLKTCWSYRRGDYNRKQKLRRSDILHSIMVVYSPRKAPRGRDPSPPPSSLFNNKTVIIMLIKKMITTTKTGVGVHGGVGGVGWGDRGVLKLLLAIRERLAVGWDRETQGRKRNTCCSSQTSQEVNAIPCAKRNPP